MTLGMDNWSNASKFAKQRLQNVVNYVKYIKKEQVKGNSWHKTFVRNYFFCNFVHK